MPDWPLAPLPVPTDRACNLMCISGTHTVMNVKTLHGQINGLANSLNQLAARLDHTVARAERAAAAGGPPAEAPAADAD